LRSVAQRAVQDKQKQSHTVEDKSSSLLRLLEGKEELPPTTSTVTSTLGTATPQTATATLQQQQQPEEAIPIMKSLDKPPPTFDSMKFPPPTNLPAVSDEMVGHGMNSRVLSSSGGREGGGREVGREGGIAPPSFDFVEQQQQLGVQSNNAPPAPTAPEVSPTEEIQHSTIDHLHGILPVAAPPLLPNDLHQQQHQGVDDTPPPSYNMFESQQQSSSDQTTAVDDDDDVLAYDENGNPLSPQQRQKLLDEQRILYENIMKEKAANDAAIAQANADAFDSRSSNAVARVAGGGTSSTLADSNRVMDSVGRDVASSASGEGQLEATTANAEEEARRRESRRMVKIGNNQMVALHGQDRTKKAIKEGTAILVQCINCQNWMQVTESATLMFCPVCQVVSPVIQQTEVMTKEEAIQLTMDRKLAEKLQAEAYAQNEQQGESTSARSSSQEEEEEGFLGRFFGGIGGAVIDATEGAAGAISSSMSSSNTATHQEERSDSWWNKISSIVSYGEPAERSDLGVTRPPGAPPSSSQYPASARQQRSPSTTTSPSRNEETRGLLSPVVVDGNEEHHLPAGRVAEQRPLFSCVADSISSATAAVFHTGDDIDDNVHGVDASSLLVTSAGRGVGDGEGDYSRLESNDFDRR